MPHGAGLLLLVTSQHSPKCILWHAFAQCLAQCHSRSKFFVCQQANQNGVMKITILFLLSEWSHHMVHTKFAQPSMLFGCLTCSLSLWSECNCLWVSQQSLMHETKLWQPVLAAQTCKVQMQQCRSQHRDFENLTFCILNQHCLWSCFWMHKTTHDAIGTMPQLFARKVPRKKNSRSLNLHESKRLQFEFPLATTVHGLKAVANEGMEWHHCQW